MLEGADLSALSSKKIRQQLEEKYGIDFTDRKKEIDDLVMELITPTEKKEEPKGSDEQNGAVSSASPTGSSSSEMEDDDEERNDGDDEELARKLQDEEVRSRSRAVKKSRPAKKEPAKAKKATKSSGTKRESAYSRKCALSPELAAVVGAEQMARSDVVKKMWSIVRERNLFDPSNRQFALCDPQLLKVFGQKRVRMFGMMKYLKNHIKDVK
uniref:Putative rna polymerase i transcription factor uaf n=1 Tax=Amblyomma aureolatum TaxID=187763 RepID=A0A1E1XHV5_9ACAR